MVKTGQEKEPTETEANDKTLNKIDKIDKYLPPETDRAQTPSDEDERKVTFEDQVDRGSSLKDSSKVVQESDSEESDTNHEQIKDLYSKIYRKVQMKCKPSMDHLKYLNSQSMKLGGSGSR